MSRPEVLAAHVQLLRDKAAALAGGDDAARAYAEELRAEAADIERRLSEGQR